MQESLFKKVRNITRVEIISLQQLTCYFSDVLTRHIRNHHNESQTDQSEISQENNVVNPNSLLDGDCPGSTSEPLSDTLVQDVLTPTLATNRNNDTDGDDILSLSVIPISDNVLGPASLDEFNDFSFPTVYEAVVGLLAPAAPQGNETAFYAWDMNFSPAAVDSLYEDQIDLVQRAWPRKRISPVICASQRMWVDAAHHPFSNLFSADIEPFTPMSEVGSISRWNLDHDCRKRLILECRSFLLPAENYSGPTTVPSSPRITTQSEHEVAIQGLSPQEPTLDFPSVEVLDSSIDFYFRRFHPHYPFIHPATFNAMKTKSPLLLAMCLVGISIVKPPGTDGFMRLYLPKFIRYCRLDLTYKGLGKGGTQQLLTSIACSLLVLYPGLACRSFVDEHQAHMLAIQTLFIADRHGMFSAHEAPSITMDLFTQ